MTTTTSTNGLVLRRHFVNDPQDFVSEALEGLELSHPDLVRWDRDSNLVVRARPATGKVGLLSGGGSGHEPLHSSFVGVGMLDVAVAGAVFASPTAKQVHAGTLAADSGSGVVQIVKNYTGDVLNFDIASELAEDLEVRRVLVDDDLATDGQVDGPGRRGTAAVVVVEKLLGAAAEAEAGLDDVAALGRRIVANSRTMSLALGAGAHPGQGRPAFELADDEVELGVGIHGERGRSRIRFAPVDELMEILVSPLVEAMSLKKGSEVLAVVNGLGTAYPLELSVAARAIHRLLPQRGVSVTRSLVGSFVTSLDMKGISVTLTAADPDLLPLWDAPVRTPALSW